MKILIYLATNLFPPDHYFGDRAANILMMYNLIRANPKMKVDLYLTSDGLIDPHERISRLLGLDIKSPYCPEERCIKLEGFIFKDVNCNQKYDFKLINRLREEKLHEYKAVFSFSNALGGFDQDVSFDVFTKDYTYKNLVMNNIFIKEHKSIEFIKDDKSIEYSSWQKYILRDFIYEYEGMRYNDIKEDEPMKSFFKDNLNMLSYFLNISKIPRENNSIYTDPSIYFYQFAEPYDFNLIYYTGRDQSLLEKSYIESKSKQELKKDLFKYLNMDSSYLNKKLYFVYVDEEYFNKDVGIEGDSSFLNISKKFRKNNNIYTDREKFYQDLKEKSEKDEWIVFTNLKEVKDVPGITFVQMIKVTLPISALLIYLADDTYLTGDVSMTLGLIYNDFTPKYQCSPHKKNFHDKYLKPVYTDREKGMEVLRKASLTDFISQHFLN